MLTTCIPGWSMADLLSTAGKHSSPELPQTIVPATEYLPKVLLPKLLSGKQQASQ
jgi:hypothetical protein